MKNWKKGLAVACAGVMSVSMLAACQGANKKTASKDPTTINVEIAKVSYGVNWAYEVAEKFEAAYADQNYKVNFMNPSSDMRNNVAIQQLARGYDATGVDMYISGGLSSEKLGQEGTYYQSAGILAEELADLWEMKPIGYDGQEESKTLKEKVTAGIYDSYKDNYGKIYAVPYMMSTGGMVVNTRKLALYGINTLPKTTGELFEMWSTIYVGANGQGNSVETKLAPFTYTPGADIAYTIDWFTAAMAQYDEKLSKEYWSWQTENEDGSVTWWEDGVSAAANDAFMASLKVMTQAFDIRIACPGTAKQTLDQAQAQIMKQSQGAIFMCNGSWYLNDMALDYKDYLQDITFINFPVNSYLADKLWASNANREAMLRAAVALVDDPTKADDTAAMAATMNQQFPGAGVTADDMAEVRRARFVYTNRTSGHEMVITKGSTKADICKLFMRMIASDDAAATIATEANAISAYTQTPNTTHQYKFVQAISTIATEKYAVAVNNDASGYRYALGKTQNAFFQAHLPSYICNLKDSKSIYNTDGTMSGETVESAYHTLAQSIFDSEKKALTENFASWKSLNAERAETYKTLWGV